MNVESVLGNLPAWTHAEIDTDSLTRELNGPHSAADMPRLYQVEVTTRCGLRCGFCPRTEMAQGKTKANRGLAQDMPMDRFVGLLDSMPWVKSIELFHFGEPFLAPDFHLYVRECKKRGIYTVAASNMANAHPAAYLQAFAEGLNFLVMDIDSVEKAGYETARTGARWETMRANVRAVLAANTRPYCVAQSIALDGVKPYSEAEFMVFSGGLKPDEYRHKFLDSFRGAAARATPLAGICREAFYGLTVQVNGDVVVCDRDYAGENVMGNLFRQGLQEIWNGPRYAAFRADMLAGKYWPMCANCSEGSLFNARSQPHIQVNMFKGGRV